MDKKYRILKSSLLSLDTDAVVNRIIHAASDNKRLTVAPVASHPLTVGYFDSTVQGFLDEIDILSPDSQYVRWAMWFLYGVKMEDRIYGYTVFHKVLSASSQKKIDICLYGNHAEKLQEIIRRDFPKIKVRGIDITGKKITKKDAVCLNRILSGKKRTVVCIGIGSPLQHAVSSGLNIDCPILLVGAAFDMMSGAQKKAPSWIGKAGFEWLYRLAYDPLRLWRRYLVYGSLFVFLIILQKLRMIVTGYRR